MSEFKVGDRVSHKEFGLGVIITIKDGSIGVVFDERNQNLHSMDGGCFYGYSDYFEPNELTALSIKENDIIYNDINNNVDHPNHYTKGKIEVWDFILDQGLGYLCGNAIKYICRAGIKHKETEIEDLRKAVAFLNKQIEVLGNEKKS